MLKRLSLLSVLSLLVDSKGRVSTVSVRVVSD